jgi:hypothetical protein
MKNQNMSWTAAPLEAREARFALRVATRLNEGARELPHDITERLKAAREQALDRARLVRQAKVAGSAQSAGTGSATLLLRGGPRSDWWLKLASALPIVVLVGGFLLIERAHIHQQISAAAEIDAALLADDVPPAAYSDPGFVEFLKAPRD